MRGALAALALCAVTGCAEAPAGSGASSATGSGGTPSRPAPDDTPDPALAKLLRKQGTCSWLADGSFRECPAQQEQRSYLQGHQNEAAFETCILSADAKDRTERALAGACLHQFTFSGSPEERARWDTRLFDVLLPRFALEPNAGSKTAPGEGVRAIFAGALSELSAERAGKTQAVLAAIRSMPRPDGRATDLLFATLTPDALQEQDPPAAVVDLAIELAVHEDAGTRRSAYELLGGVKTRPELTCKLFPERIAKDEDSWPAALSSYAAAGDRCVSERPAALAAVVVRLQRAADAKRSRDDELKDFSGLRRFVRLPLTRAEEDTLIAALESLTSAKLVSEREANEAQQLLQELRSRQARPTLKQPPR